MPSTTCGICRTRSKVSRAFSSWTSFAAMTFDASIPRRGVGCFGPPGAPKVRAHASRVLTASSAPGSSVKKPRRLIDLRVIPSISPASRSIARVRLSFLAGRHLLLPYEPAQEVAHPVPGGDPPAVEHRFVRVVRNDDQLVVDVPRAKELHESHRLRKVHVPVVIAMHEQDGRAPAIDGRDRRRC